MKKLLIFVLLLQTVCLTAAAQNFIPIVVQQYPPLTVVAHTVVLELSQEGATLGSDLTVEGGDGKMLTDIRWVHRQRCTSTVQAVIILR